jgi:hypothetical protein
VRGNCQAGESALSRPTVRHATPPAASTHAHAARAHDALGASQDHIRLDQQFTATIDSCTHVSATLIGRPQRFTGGSHRGGASGPGGQVDTTSTTLVTKAAPWSSIVHRAPRWGMDREKLALHSVHLPIPPRSCSGG